MTSLQRLFSSRKVQLKSHVISEVGDGKNLTDTDFQLVQRSLEQAKAGGGSTQTALEILNALQAFPSVGTINVGIDLGARAQEPKTDPKAYSGIDNIYHRDYEYDETGAFTGLRLFQFFEIGTGRFVTKAALHQLWKDEFAAAGELAPKRLEPTVPRAAKARQSKWKACEATAAAIKMGHAALKAEREARRAQQLLEAAAAARKRTLERAERGQQTFECEYVAQGCTHRQFIRKANTEWHARCGCPFRPKSVPAPPPDGRTREAMLSAQRKHAESSINSASVRVRLSVAEGRARGE
eukprot:6469160-Prymnesium_polylepis.1